MSPKTWTKTYCPSTTKGEAVDSSNFTWFVWVHYALGATYTQFKQKELSDTDLWGAFYSFNIGGAIKTITNQSQKVGSQAEGSYSWKIQSRRDLPPLVEHFSSLRDLAVKDLFAMCRLKEKGSDEVGAEPTPPHCLICNYWCIENYQTVGLSHPGEKESKRS